MEKQIFSDFIDKYRDAEMVVIGIGEEWNAYLEKQEYQDLLAFYAPYLEKKNYFCITSSKKNDFSWGSLNPKRVVQPLLLEAEQITSEKKEEVEKHAVLSDWPYYYIPISPEGKHLLQLAVFSRYPIKEENLIVYPDSKNCSLWCDIEINGRIIRLFNNHLQTTEVSQNKRKLEKGLRTDDSQRVERAALGLIDGLHENFRKRAVQANTLKQLIAASPYPTIICGDFNSLPSSYVYHTVKGDKLQDGFQTSGHGYMYTFKFFKHLLRIDYILHSPELNSTDYFSPDLTYSDHNPVVMRVKL